MKTNEDYKKLARLRRVETDIKAHLASLIATSNFPKYYDSWCRRLGKISEAIIELKYK